MISFSGLRLFIATAIALSLGIYPTLVLAANSVPSCYAPLGIAPPVIQNISLYVLVDQTVNFNADVKKNLGDSAQFFLAPGNEFQVLEFSAFSQGRYMDTVATGALEAGLPQGQRDNTGSDTLALLDNCLIRQRLFGRRLMSAALNKAMAAYSDRLARSDILGSLQNLAELVSHSRAKRRVVLLASDMLENSSITSFYRSGGVRKIDVPAELKKVAEAHMFANFRGANVYVIGAGLLDPSEDAQTKFDTLTYRDPLTMAELRAFWTEYFRISGGHLLGFGEPMLLAPAR